MAEYSLRLLGDPVLRGPAGPVPRALELVLRGRRARQEAAQLARGAHERDVRSALRERELDPFVQAMENDG